MNLSARRKRGMVHAVVDDLLKVVKPHAVSSDGVGQERADKGAAPSELWLWCNEGDLAIVLKNAKTGERIGVSYLSGPAIQIVNYRPTDPDWFEPATALFLDKPDMQEVAELATTDDYDVVIFLKQTMEVQAEKHRLIEAVQTQQVRGRGPTCHVIGLIRDGRKLKGSISIHFQPARHASDLACSWFQNLALSYWARRNIKNGKTQHP